MLPPPSDMGTSRASVGSHTVDREVASHPTVQGCETAPHVGRQHRRPPGCESAVPTTAPHGRSVCRGRPRDLGSPFPHQPPVHHSQTRRCVGGRPGDFGVRHSGGKWSGFLNPEPCPFGFMGLSLPRWGRLAPWPRECPQPASRGGGAGGRDGAGPGDSPFPGSFPQASSPRQPTTLTT